MWETVGNTGKKGGALNQAWDRLGDYLTGDDYLATIDVLSGLQRPDRRQRMPVIRRGDDDGIDVLVVEHAAHLAG